MEGRERRRDRAREEKKRGRDGKRRYGGQERDSLKQEFQLLRNNTDVPFLSNIHMTIH